ncbi:MAG TPA: tetrahydrofolate dehydrogenase/cyclohydrolase catalytic domain-containing protein, partial [Candidatus Paceibacterota bacterium]|nr:tetrahydrofolate dehydrogenase/cyclohydrolase catalytic domain-containing protein [Candidatus Paceibacterota bacterium]
MTIDGKKIAEEIYTELSEFFKTRNATLGIIVAGVDPVIEQFVRIKTRAAERLGITMHRVDLVASATTADVIAAVETMKQTVDALIVQLPLPPSVDTNAALSSIPADKDVDAINPRHSSEHLVQAP